MSLLCLALILWATVTAARHRAAFLDFYPLNGDFQNFNPIRRWLAGEAPGRDFNAYLGLGPTGLMTLATALLGGDYRASLAAVTGLCVLFQALAFGLAARGVGLSRTAALSVAAISVLFVAAPYKLWMTRHLQAVLVGLSEHLLKPGNSVLGLRAAAPLVAALLLWWSWTWWRPGSHPVRRVILLGLVGGLILPWSNDYGPSTAFALGIMSAWSAYPDLSRRRWAAALLAQVATMLATATAVVALLTGGAPVDWFQSAFVGVAQDQFWYFDGRKLLTLGDLPLFPSLLLGTLCVAAWLASSRVTQFDPDSTADPRDHTDHPGRRERLALLLLLTPFVAALLSMAGGHVGWRYTFPLTRMLYLFVPALAVRILLVAVAVTRQWRTGGPRLPLPFTRPLESLLCLLLAVQVVTLARRYVGELRRQPVPAAPWQIDVPELRGQISARFGPALDLARDLASEANTNRLPPNHRLLSTYTSLIDLVAGASTPTRADYLIHALGDRERSRYLDSFRSTAPAHVLTIRDDFDGWDGWLRRQNWDVYRELLTHYAETDRTCYARLWSRLDQPRSPMNLAVPHRVAIQSASTIVLEFRLPDSIPSDGGDILCEVDLDYTTSATVPLWRHGVLRQALEAIEPERPFRIFGMATWGLPTGTHHRTFPIELTPGRSQLLVLDLAPNNVSRLDIHHLTCTALFPVRDVDDPPVRQIRTARWSAGPWNHGLARPDAVFSDAPPGVARFLAADLTDLRHLLPGDELHFAKSGIRRITTITGPRVTVAGPALLPRDADQPIRVVHPVWRPHHSTNADIILSDIQTPDWNNGICIDAGRAGCFVRDPNQIRGLEVGHRLEFAGSGIRRVVAIENMLVWVDGPALDPALDGPPETVRWLDPPANAKPWRDWIRPAVRSETE